MLEGDLNADIQALHDWMVTHSCQSPAHSLVQDTRQFNTFWCCGTPSYDDWVAVSWIDHILLYSPSIIQGSAVSLGMGPLWATISDYHPISLWLRDQAFKISETMDQRPKSLPPRIIKLNFKDKDEATLTLYRGKVSEAICGNQCQLHPKGSNLTAKEEELPRWMEPCPYVSRCKAVLGNLCGPQNQGDRLGSMVALSCGTKGRDYHPGTRIGEHGTHSQMVRKDPQKPEPDFLQKNGEHYQEKTRQR